MEKHIGFAGALAIILLIFLSFTVNAQDNNTDNNSGNGNPIACVAEGETGPVYPGYACCEGLEAASPSVAGSDGICIDSVGSFVCINCGNGECGKGENTCNCPEDCSKACPAIYAPVCGVDGETYSNDCMAEVAGVKIACSGECPCKRTFYISSIWTDQSRYVLGEDDTVYIYAKIVDSDGSPSTPEEGTSAVAKITQGLIIASQGNGKGNTSVSSSVSVIEQKIELRYNSTSGYFEAKTRVPDSEGTYVVAVTASNKNRSPSEVTSSTSFYVQKKNFNEIIYVNLNEKFEIIEGQQANVQDDGSTVMKMHYDSTICIATATAEDAFAPDPNAGCYATLSISAKTGGVASIRLKEGQSTEVGEYKVSLLELGYENSGWTAVMLVQKENTAVVYAELDRPFWLDTDQTAAIKNTGVKMTLEEMLYADCANTAGTDCSGYGALAMIKANVPPYEVNIGEGKEARLGDYILKFNEADGSKGNFTVSKQTIDPTIRVHLNEKFSLKEDQKAEIIETGLGIKLTGILMPTQVRPAVTSASGAVTAVNANAVRTGSGKTIVEEVSSTGEVKNVEKPIRIDPRGVAELEITLPPVCREDETGGSCGVGAMLIRLRQGESRVVSGHKIHALRVSSNEVVLIVKKAVDDYIEAWLDREFKLSQKQTAHIVNADLFLRLDSISYNKCISSNPENNTEGNTVRNTETKCIGGQFATISVWMEKNIVLDTDSGTESEMASSGIRAGQIRIYPGRTVEMYGYKIKLVSLSSNVAYFIVSQKNNPNEINVHVGDRFKLEENMRANVLEANIKIEVLGLDNDSVKFSVSNFLYTKEYIGTDVDSASIEEVVSGEASSSGGTGSEVVSTASANAVEKILLESDTGSSSIMPMPPMPFHVYTLSAGESIEIGDFVITVLDVNPKVAVFIVEEKGYNQTIVIDIRKGWNLFSLPGDLTAETTDCDSTKFRLYEFNTERGAFYSVSEPKPGKAYWLYNSGESCTAKALLRRAVSIDELESLGIGWNFVAVVPDMIGKKINDLGNCNLSTAYYFDAQNKEWKDAMQRSIGLDLLGQALAVYSNNACSLGGYGVTPPMPPTPAPTQEPSIDTSAIIEAKCGVDSSGSTTQCPEGYSCNVFKEAGIANPVCIKEPVCSFVTCPEGECIIASSYPGQIMCS